MKKSQLRFTTLERRLPHPLRCSRPGRPGRSQARPLSVSECQSGTMQWRSFHDAVACTAAGSGRADTRT